MAAKVHLVIVFLLTGILKFIWTQEDYKCPRDQFYLFPCRCLAGNAKGLLLNCDNSNLATIALALTNVKEPLETLSITSSNITRLFGPIFKEKVIHSLTIQNSQMHEIEVDSMTCLKPSIRSLQLDTNRFDVIPESVNVLHNLTRLAIVNTNSITELKSGTFNKLVNLIELDLHNNSIKKIESSSFAALVTLERLDLSKNQLNKLERNLFRTNKKLNYLDLSHNRFKEIGKADFNDLVSINTLNLSHNELTELPRSIFSRVSQLKVLNLSHNRFKQVDSYMLRGVRFLREFIASGNLIRELAKNAFVSTTRIKLINLSHNALVEVETEIFKDMQWLDLIDLSYNRLNKLKKGSFQRMFKIAIKLNNNNISTIEYKTFQELSNITELDLSHNKLSNLKANIFEECDCTVFRLEHNLISNLSQVDIFANLTGMRLLNLSHNFIGEVNRKHFTLKKLYELNSIDLSYNNISELSGNAFEKFVSIRSINLTHNRLQKIGYAAFGSLSTLLDLDISHNEIKEITNGGVSNLLSVKTIHAEHNQLESMFPISVALNALHLEHNKISKIRSSMFPVINAILEIHLDHNNISDIDGDTFVNCLSLHTLSLSDNHLSKVPQQALSPLTSLQNLDLSHNELTKLDKTAFGTLRILFNLNLSNNSIFNVSDNAFEGLLQLLSLNISHNRLSFISPNVFNTMVSLHTLDLSHNQISGLDNSTHSIFEQLLSLERLNLSHNKISLVKDRSFPHSPWVPYKLAHLDLSFNSIPLLTSHFDNGLTKLEWLSLRGNIINEIFPGVLGNLTKLKHLDLSLNDLRKLPKGIFRPSMQSLQLLDMSYNKLSSFFVDEFNQMIHLNSLNLSFNKLTHIDEKFFPQIKKGLQFWFQGNHLYCDCKLMPLVAWIYSEQHKAQLLGQTSNVYQHWASLRCSDPNTVQNKELVQLRASMLDCAKTEVNKYNNKFLNSRFVQLRTIEKFRKRRQESIKLVWFVQNRVRDIAQFKILLRDKDQESYLVNETVGYHKRDYIVNGLTVDRPYVVCIFAIDSIGQVNYDFEHDCVPFYNAHGSVVYQEVESGGQQSHQPLLTKSSVPTSKFTLAGMNQLLLIVCIIYSFEKIFFFLYI